MKNILLLLLFLPTLAFSQQLAHKSAFNEIGFVWNPAMTASNEFMEFGATFRQQWMGFQDAPRTATLGMQFPFLDNNMSLGGFIMVDQTKPLRTNSLSVTYAYKLELGLADYDQLSIGFLGTISESHIDNRNVIVNDIDDELLPNSTSTKIIPNAGFGLYYTSYSKGMFDENYFFAGLGANQLIPINLTYGTSETATNLKRVIHANALFGYRFINEDIAIQPSAWANYAADNLFNVNLGIKMERYQSFWAGLSYSTDQTISMQAGVILKNDFLKDGTLRIGTLGTYNVGRVGQYQGLGYEVYVAYRFEL